MDKNKNINLVIEETKAELLNFVNNKLQVLPLSVMDLIIDNISIQLKREIIKTINENEAQQNDKNVEPLNERDYSA
nr:MAG TPA: hypothetical protein [Caudoviricetes sp.]